MVRKTYSGICLLFLLGSMHASNTPPPVALTVTPQNGGGFFVELKKVLSSIMHYEDRGLVSVFVNWAVPYFPYTDDKSSSVNGWDLFFEPIETDFDGDASKAKKTGQQSGSIHELHSNCSEPWYYYKKYKPYREYAHQFFEKYIRVKPYITEQVEQFYTEHMQGHYCIAVHIRNSRWVENRVPTAVYMSEVDALLKRHSDESVKIFVASDSYEAVEKMKQKYGDQLLCLNVPRQHGNNDPVFDAPGRKPGYKAGLGALLDCLLMAKCDIFIHICSNVANFVPIFNPDIDSIYLPRGRPFKRCPHRKNGTLKNPYLFCE